MSINFAKHVLSHEGVQGRRRCAISRIVVNGEMYCIMFSVKCSAIQETSNGVRAE